MIKKCARQGIILVALATFAGCGGSDAPPRYPVKGTVTFQGEPAAAGTVNFFNEDVGSAGVKIGPDGKYDFEPTGGLQEGVYKVTVMPPEQFTSPPEPGRPMVPPKEYPNFPQKYREVASTDLTATVEATEDGNTFDFEMTP